jgi:DNA-binding transcriptional MerR regulator
LLKPRRTRSGYRVYCDADLPRLQRILVLKFLGLPLADIAGALKNESRLDDLLKARRHAVKRKREQLAMVLHLLDDLQGGPRNWAEQAAFVRSVGGDSAPKDRRSSAGSTKRDVSSANGAWRGTRRCRTTS